MELFKAVQRAHRFCRVHKINQWCLMVLLDLQHRGPSSVGLVARRVEIHRSQLTRTIRVLVYKDFVTRSLLGRDLRSYTLTITELGSKCLEGLCAE